MNEEQQTQFRKKFVKDINEDGSYLCVIADPKEVESFISNLITEVVKDKLEQHLSPTEEKE